MSRRHRVSLGVAAVAVAIFAIAIAFTCYRQDPVLDARGDHARSPSPEGDRVGAVALSSDPGDEVVRVPGEAADSAASATPEDPALSQVPSDEAIATLRGVLQTEIRSFEEALRVAEAKAGESEGAYVEFLQAELRLRMRQEAEESLDRREVVLIPATSKKAAFSRPYMSYTTSQKLGNKAALICVPVREARSQVPDLRKAVQETREAMFQSFVASHNVKMDAERLAVRTAFEAGKGLPGIPTSLEPWISYRVKFTTGDFIELMR